MSDLGPFFTMGAKVLTVAKQGTVVVAMTQHEMMAERIARLLNEDRLVRKERGTADVRR